MGIKRELVGLAQVFAVALGTALALIVVCGYPPILALKALAVGSLFSLDGLANTLASSIPLVFTGMAVAVAFRAGALNIGAEGQFLAGALAAVIVGTQFHSLPDALILPAALGAGALAGAATAGVAGALRAWRGIPEVISTIMLNFIVIQIISYAVNGPLMVPGSGLPQSAPMDPAARFALFSSRHNLHAGLWVAIAASAAVAFMLWRTTFGFRLRAVGANPLAARHAGMPVGRTLLAAMAISGLLAGLGGAVEMAGVVHQLDQSFLPGYGYTGIAVAMLGGLRPAGVLLAALFFGALAAGSGEMQRSAANIPSVMVFAIQGVVILFSIARGIKTIPRPK